MQSITMGAFTGTWTNAVNNNNITVTTGTAFNASGAGTRTINLGSATYTISGAVSGWSIATTLNLTFTGTSATIVMSGATGGLKTFNGGGLSYGTVTLGAATGSGYYFINGSNTIATLNVAGTSRVQFPSGGTNTIATMNIPGTVSEQVLIETDHATNTSAIAATTFNVTYAAFRGMTFTGTPSANSSFNLGNNSGITISAPSGSGSVGARVIGG